MEIFYRNMILRNMKQSDIEDYVRWFTTETEWMDWDAPWEADRSDEETERKRWTREYGAGRAMPDEELRRGISAHPIFLIYPRMILSLRALRVTDAGIQRA